jgi:PAS domain S-box-containing protein
MKLRIILIVLSLLAFLSASIGGFLYYSSLKESAFEQAERQAALEAERIKTGLSSFLSENLRSVKALAGLEELKQALSSKDDDVLAVANLMLDHFNNSLGADVCYLMDYKGNTVASSNRNAADSFVGENFAFRPYWRQAIQGDPATYMALGITSKKRGVYYSHPVYGDGGDSPKGVAVIKASIEPLEKEFSQTYEGIVLLTDPHGIIFISNRANWLLHSLWKLSPEELTGVVNSLQFGIGPWKSIGLEIKQDNYVIDESKNEYLMYRKKVDKYPGWNVVYLRNLNAISKALSDPLLSITGSIILSLCGLIGLSVFFLYKKASYDIIRRKEAEEALRKSEERYRSLYHNTPAMLHSIDNQGRLISVSDYWVKALGYERDEVIARKSTDFLTEASRIFAEKKVLPEFLRTGHCKDVSYQFVKKNGEKIDVLLSAIAERDQEENITRSLAVLLDVTEQKRAQAELKKAKEELSSYSKDLERQVNERTREISGILRYTPAVVYIKDKEGKYLMVNSRYEELFGVRSEDIRGKTAHDIFPKELADQFQADDLQVFNERRTSQVEEEVPLKDGVRTYISVKFPLYDEQDSVYGVCGIATDITELKKVQDQLRRLSGSIMAGQEKERAAIARELHDELGQVLTALRMDCVWMRDRLKVLDAKASERTFAMCELIDQTIDDVRSIAVRLRPGVLDDLGLTDALEWYTNDFEKRTGIACTFNHLNVPEVNEMVATAAYRITQEALTNVARHSSATHVDVILQAKENRLSLEVVDNGRGFSTQGLKESECLGMAGMRERASLVGGSVDIRSQPGTGATVFLDLPIDRGAVP